MHQRTESNERGTQEFTQQKSIRIEVLSESKHEGEDKGKIEEEVGIDL